MSAKMSLDYHRGFKRLGWVVVLLCLPVVIFVSYQESQGFAGFSRDKISELYPKLSAPVKPAFGRYKFNEAGEVVDLAPQLTVEETMAILTAERNGTLEQSKRDVVAELRSRNKFPLGSEVETQRLNKTKFAVLVASLEAGLVIFVQGGIALAAWIIRGFISQG